MIGLSRFRRACAGRVIAALLLLSSPIVGSCDVLGHSCTLIGCPGYGLDINFTGDLPANTTLDIQIDNDERTLPPVPVITCVLTSSDGPDSGTERLLCTSQLAVSQNGPRTLKTNDIFEGIRVTISQNGTQLSQQTFTPTYTHTTPNGPDCGECIFSSIQVALPQIAQP